jgi:integrase/recombinase XerD
MDCYAVLLYAQADESAEEKEERDIQENMAHGDSYWSYMTPEATKYLKKYHNQRKRSGEVFDDNTPIFRKEYQSKQANENIMQLSKAGVVSTIQRILKATSINRNKKGRRYDVQSDHGFRKRFNTILKLENNLNSNIAEKIMGHKHGLDGVYFTPTREQGFAEFIKAIPELTVNPQERQKIKILEQSKRIDELETEREKTHRMKITAEKYKNDFEQLKTNQDKMMAWIERQKNKDASG